MVLISSHNIVDCFWVCATLFGHSNIMGTDVFNPFDCVDNKPSDLVLEAYLQTRRKKKTSFARQNKVVLFTMNFRLSSILLAFSAVLLTINHETEAKAILDFFFDTPNYQNDYHRHYQHTAPVQPQRPIGGKERYKQICNVVHGISRCYA